MFALSRLVVPVDFSSNCLSAVREAAALAVRFGSEITLLHAAEFPLARFAGPLGYGISSAASVRDDFLAQRRAELDAFAVNELSGLPVKRVMCRGDAAKIIADRAAAGNADLIVMTTHGYGPVRRHLLGSVTAKVLHDSDCPVWTTRTQTEPAPHLEVRHVMCALNFRPQDCKTLRWAARFASAFDAKLTVVHAILGAPPEMPERYVFTWHDEARWGADERLRVLLAELEIEAGVLVVEGEAPAALASAAKENSADVMVIGRDQATSMSGRLDSLCYGIVCEAPCPVISL